MKDLKEFDRKSVKELHSILQEKLNEISEELGITLTMGSASFRNDLADFHVKATIQNEDGSTFIGDRQNTLADNAAKAIGVNFMGNHFIGTIWKLSGNKIYKVVGYNSKRRTYPIELITPEGRTLKCSPYNFMSYSKQILPPSRDSFITWATLNTDDAEAKGDTKSLEIYDDTKSYLELSYPIELSYRLIDAVDSLYDLGYKLKKGFGEMYSILDALGIEEACEFAEKLLAENSTTKKKGTKK